MSLFRNIIPQHVFIMVLAMGLLNGCGNQKEEEEKDDMIETPDTVKSTVLNVAGELFSVPSPIQTALLIQKSGIGYDKSWLSASHKVNVFSTEFSRALNLGIYGADLGYVSLNSQTQDALGYLAAIKQLTDKLGISSAFDQPTMERFKNNITNKDSMMGLVGTAYRQSDAYLKDNKRTDISSLILTGGWIESMHFSIMALKAKPNNQIRYRIAEQKLALASIIKILKGINTTEVTELNGKLGELAQVYEKIQFRYNFVEPRTDTVKKVTYINSTTEVDVTEEQILQISEKVTEIRNKIVNTTKS
jgi:hypothetical protein